MSAARTVSQLHDLTGRTPSSPAVRGGGLGLQMAHTLGEAGARLLISSRKQGDLHEAAAELRAAGHRVDTFASDGREEAQALALVDHALAKLGAIDILVNNAGATWGAPAQDHPLDASDKVMDLNVRGVFLLAREVARRSMLRRGSGRIINIASIAALGGSNSMQAAAYHASKGAVAALTRALACEWGPHGITVGISRERATCIVGERFGRGTPCVGGEAQYVDWQPIHHGLAGDACMERRPAGRIFLGSLPRLRRDDGVTPPAAAGATPSRPGTPSRPAAPSLHPANGTRPAARSAARPHPRRSARPAR